MKKLIEVALPLVAINAEALARGATLITRDQAITASGLVPVVW